MKSKNQRIWSNDIEKLKLIKEDFDYIGRTSKLDESLGLLVVYAIQPKRQKQAKEKQPRNKREESAQRNSR